MFLFYFSVGQPPRCIAGNPFAPTRPQKFTTSAWRPRIDEDQQVIIEQPPKTL